MKTLALVPARAGSKGIPGKNVRPFHGKPLLAWAVEIGRRTCERVYVSTESSSIALIGAGRGAEIVMRPPSLATDEAPMLPVIKHALSDLAPGYVPDVVVLLQPTQPLRRPEHVRLALEMLTDDWDSVVSVVQIPEHYSPDLAARIVDGRLSPLLSVPPMRRQDCRPAYVRDGTVYVIRREVIEGGSLYGSNCRAMVVPFDESCTLDTEDDWRRAEQMTKAVA